MQTTVTVIIEQIESRARETARLEVRRVVSLAIGQAVRQGDIYLHRVADDHPRGAPRATRQLAVGVTVGSRHVAEPPAVVYEGTAAPAWAPRALLGPLVVATARLSVTHPEHAHLELPCGTYQVTHQLDAASMARVED